MSDEQQYVHLVIQHQPSEFDTDQVVEAYECEESAQAEVDALNKEYGNNKSHRYYVTSVKLIQEENNMTPAVKATIQVALAIIAVILENLPKKK